MQQHISQVWVDRLTPRNILNPRLGGLPLASFGRLLLFEVGWPNIEGNSSCNPLLTGLKVSVATHTFKVKPSS
jgi:hypothetical protein